MARIQHALPEIIGDQAFVIIREYQRIEPLERSKKRAQEALLGKRAKGLPAFMVHANQMLVPGDDARFYGGDALGVREDAFVADLRGAQTVAQHATGLVAANRPESLDTCSEPGQVRRHVAHRK